jgi:hypothetical protein
VPSGCGGDKNGKHGRDVEAGAMGGRVDMCAGRRQGWRLACSSRRQTGYTEPMSRPSRRSARWGLWGEQMSLSAGAGCFEFTACKSIVAIACTQFCSRSKSSLLVRNRRSVALLQLLSAPLSGHHAQSLILTNSTPLLSVAYNDWPPCACSALHAHCQYFPPPNQKCASDRP